MKKLFVVSGFVMLCLAGKAQTDGVDAFLGRYQALVVMVEAEETVSDEEYKVFSAKFDELTNAYHATYKERMSDDQLSKYMELRTRYQKKMVDRTAVKVGEKIDSVSQNVIKGVRKTGSKIGGLLKGIFSKK